MPSSATLARCLLRVPAGSSSRLARPAVRQGPARAAPSALPLLRRPLHSTGEPKEDGKEKAQQELRDMSRIDQLLNEIGRTSNSAEGIPMRNKAPWEGVHSPEPWSFSYDPNASRSAAVAGDNAGAEPKSSKDAAAVAEGVLDEPELTPRRMSDSYVEISLPLLSDPVLLAPYVSTTGGLRLGRLMEHLDSLAGAISYKHVLPANTTDFQQAADSHHVYLATASADRLDLFAPLQVQDLKLSGHVVFAGNSSMEVFIKMEGLREGGKNETLMLGRFTMVARDSRTHGARKINPLIVETQAEKDLFAIGREHKKRKQDFTRTSLSRQPPTAAEIQRLHEFMLRHKGFKGANDGLATTASTVIRETALMHPSERNLHGKVFGGYLMRLAFELSYSSAVLFARSPMRFLALDEISFALPVPIGSVLRLTATITKSSLETGQVHSQVAAEVVNVATGKTEKTNDFHFTFAKDDSSALTREVVPETYHEAMAWLEAERRMSTGNAMRALVHP